MMSGNLAYIFMCLHLISNLTKVLYPQDFYYLFLFICFQNAQVIDSNNFKYYVYNAMGLDFVLTILVRNWNPLLSQEMCIN